MGIEISGLILSVKRRIYNDRDTRVYKTHASSSNPSDGGLPDIHRTLLPDPGRLPRDRNQVRYPVPKHRADSRNVERSELHAPRYECNQIRFGKCCSVSNVELITFGGRQPQPGNGKPSEPSGHGASSPGTPCSPLSPRSPLRPRLPSGPASPLPPFSPRGPS